MEWIIDRIEGNIAVCEYEAGKTVDVLLSALPKGVKEGDTLDISIDLKKSNERKENINKLMNSLFED